MPPRPPRWPITGAVAVVTSFALVGAAPMTAEAAAKPPADGAVQMASRVSAAPLKAEAVTQRAQTNLRAATFNVRTSRADRGTSRQRGVRRIENKQTGQNFFFVSVHLDERHSGP